MRTPVTALVVAALAFVVSTHDADAARKTVCSITVNSPDERETFRRYLPSEQYDFVELVEHGRPDWLASACRTGVRCDALIISGHFDGGTEFYSDRLDARESLPVAELERASCSDSCQGLFADLKEVYLFGCNTLNAEALKSATAEVGRSLLRSGHSPADVERITQLLDQRHGESNRDRMREIFKDVPVIYGFSSKAPLGRYAAATLERYFQSGNAGDVGSGRPSQKLLGLFAPVSMTATAGITSTDGEAAYRQEVCQFADERLSATQKLAFVHTLLGREMAEVRMFLDRIEAYLGSLDDAARQDPATARVWAEISADTAARSRFLDFTRDADRSDTRARMLAVARSFGWLTPEQERAELLRMFGEQLAGKATGAAEVELACGLNRDGALGRDLQRLHLAAVPDDAPRAAVLACLGNPEAHARVVRALTSPNDADVQIAQVYLKHRPLQDGSELRTLAADIARMSTPEAQVLALETLAQQGLADRESLEELARLFSRARSVQVQRAIAGILIRADYHAIASTDLVRALRQSRLKSNGAEDAIDILIRRMELAISGTRAGVSGT